MSVKMVIRHIFVFFVCLSSSFLLITCERKKDVKITKEMIQAADNFGERKCSGCKDDEYCHIGFLSDDRIGIGKYCWKVPCEYEHQVETCWNNINLNKQLLQITWSGFMNHKKSNGSKKSMEIPKLQKKNMDVWIMRVIEKSSAV